MIDEREFVNTPNSNDSTSDSPVELHPMKAADPQELLDTSSIIVETSQTDHAADITFTSPTTTPTPAPTAKIVDADKSKESQKEKLNGSTIGDRTEIDQGKKDVAPTAEQNNLKEETVSPTKDAVLSEEKLVPTDLNLDQPEPVSNLDILSQASVDAQMEKVIENVVELGAGQQISEQQLIDEVEELKNIQREIIGDSEPIRPIENKQHIIPTEEEQTPTSLEEITQNTQEAKIEPLQKAVEEDTVHIETTILNNPDTLETKGVEKQVEVVEQALESVDVEEKISESKQLNDSNGVEEEKKVPQKVDTEPQIEKQEPQTEEKEPQTEEKEPQTEKLELQAEEQEPQKEELEPQTEKLVPQTEKLEPPTEKLEQQTVKQPRKEKQASRKEKQEPPKQKEEEDESPVEERRPIRSARLKINKVEVVEQALESVDVEEKSSESKQLNDANGVKEEKQTPRKEKQESRKEKQESRKEKQEPLKQKEEEDESPVEEKRPIRSARLKVNKRATIAVEIPVVEKEPAAKEKKPTKRARPEAENPEEESLDKSLEPVIKAPLTSRTASSRITIATTQPMRNRELDYSSYVDDSITKKYQCENCKYSTDRLNNIVYHKKTACTILMDKYNVSVERYKQLLQSPKSNSRRRG